MLKIYPNPAMDEIAITIVSNANNSGTLKFSIELGSGVMEELISLTEREINSRLMFSFSAAGIYLWNEGRVMRE